MLAADVHDRHDCAGKQRKGLDEDAKEGIWGAVTEKCR
jgi:hypothetical protein